MLSYSPCSRNRRNYLSETRPAEPCFCTLCQVFFHNILFYSETFDYLNNKTSFHKSMNCLPNWRARFAVFKQSREPRVAFAYDDAADASPEIGRASCRER